jgi:pimeloyl-ACP methyl ester carboxylesterase
MAYLNRDGVKIYYEEWGSGPAVLLSHGYSASARMWQGQLEALSDRYHLIAFDMRGHDRSDSPDDPARYSHELTIGDMSAVLEQCAASGHQWIVVGRFHVTGVPPRPSGPNHRADAI